MLQSKSLRFESTVHQFATVLDGKEIHSYITKTLTFPTSGPLLRHKQAEFQKNNFIFLILAYSGSRTCPYFQIPSSIKEVVLPPGNDVSDKPLTPLGAHHPSDYFDINYKSVR